MIRKLVPIGVIIILAAGVFIFNEINSSSKDSLEQYADAVIEKCEGAASQRCYDREIPRFMDELTMEEVFEVTRIVQDKDPGYWFCHELGHNVSEREYDKDPSKWDEVITRCPVGMCSNGCVHGAFQKHFIAESLNDVQLEEVMPLLENLCEPRPDWNPTPLEQASCYHELGHLSHYLTGTDIEKSQELCDTVSVKSDGRNYIQTCYEGMFMQLFEPREPEDFALIYNIIPYKEKLTVCEKYTDGIEKGACWKIGWLGKVNEFCGQWSGELRNACFREAWIVEDEKIKTPEGITQYCTYALTDKEERLCYNKIFYSLMAIYEFDSEKVLSICEGLPESVRSHCFADVASRKIETDKRLIDAALGICKKAEAEGLEAECYKGLAYYATFAFHPGSEDNLKLCNGIPAPWNEECK